MKTLQDLRLDYKMDTGLEATYEVDFETIPFMGYATWLEERLLKELNRPVPSMVKSGIYILDLGDTRA
jgi:hypothetical protein